MAKKSKRAYGGDAKLDMTPMIDVVFQLIIFFVVTMTEEDVLSQLTALAPAPSKSAAQEEPPTVIEIDIYNPAAQGGGTGFLIAKRPATLEQLDEKLAYYAQLNKNTTVMFRNMPDAPHGQLVQALNLCYKHQMTNLAIFSL